MAAQPGISTSAAPPNTVVEIQPGMNVQPVVLVDQNGNYVTASTANALATTTAPVNVGNATAPTSGQVLTAASGTAATWQAPGGAPSGNAGGDLGSTYPDPTVTATHLASPLPLVQGGTAQNAASNAALLTALGAAALGGAAFSGEVTVQTPVNPSDAVTKAYADAIAQGLSVKPSVQEATAAALPANTYSNGASGVGATLTAALAGVLTVDGIAVALGDRVLVQNEAAPANNGIYTVTTLGTVGVAYILTRAVDMNTAASIPGAFAFTEQGTANTGAGFTVASEGPFTIGTTAVTWTQFSGAGEITSGTGLSKSGNTLSLITPVAAGNLPTGTTSTKGALQLDGTATDIQPTGTQAAGSSGQAADAKHVHFSSGMYLCAPSIYAPAGQVRLAVSSTTLAPFNSAPTTVAAGSNGGEISQVATWSAPSAGVLDVASTTGYPPSGTLTVAASGATTAVITYTGTSGGNSFTGCAYVSGSATGTVATGGAVTLTSVTLQTNSFTAPPSGSVLVTLHCALDVATTADSVMLALEQSGTIYGYTATYALSGSGVPGVVTVLLYVTGLNAGNSYQFQLYGAATSAISAVIFTQGLTSTAIGNNGAPVVMTVQAV
jgi:hypothetical protein